MYLSKPQEGFCIPVLYIKKEELDIAKLLDIDKSSEDVELNYLGKNLYHDLSDNNEGLIIEDEALNASRSEKNDRLIFDVDEDSENHEVPESLIDRKINELGAEALGVLILDGDPMEENQK